MLKRTFALIAVLTALSLQTASRNAAASNCYEECRDSYQTCPTMCGASEGDCYQGYLVCQNACAQYNQAWLIC